MIGRRVQPDENGYPPWLESGDYVRVAPVRRADGTDFTDEDLAKWYNKPYWMCKSPNGHAGNLSRHEVVEHEDGTITVTPSILISDGKGTTFWHGYLTAGVWREC